jgi:hypothetical protein
MVRWYGGGHMANTSAQLDAARWIVAELSSRFSQRFEERLIYLTWGGKFKFDAVSEDGTILANISTSQPKTAKGKPAIGKFHKIRSDALYLLHAVNAKQRLLIFTEKNMQEHFEGEQKSGRFPPEVELLCIELPENINNRVNISRYLASKEVTPKK